MPLYNCEVCNFSSKILHHYKRHLNTLKHKRNTEHFVIPKESPKNEPQMNQNEPKMNHNEPAMNQNEPVKNIKKFKCQYCNSFFNTLPSKRRHELHRCNVFKKQLSYEDLYKKAEKEKKEFKKQIEKLIEKVGTTTINNTQNIQLNSYGKEDLSHITDHMKTQLLSMPYAAIPKMIESVHFNDKKPENQNIVYTNKKDNKVKIFTNNKWVFKNKDETINDLMDGKYFILDSHYDKICEKNHEIFEKFQKMFDEKDKDLMEEQKKLCELVLLNNR